MIAQRTPSQARSWSAVTEVFVLQLIAHVFSLVQLLAHELFELIYCIKIQIFFQMPPKKKVIRLEEQTQLSFANQRLEQEGQEPATAIEKDDATTTQAKSKERKFFKPKAENVFMAGLQEKWQLQLYMYCRVCAETRKSNRVSK